MGNRPKTDSGVSPGCGLRVAGGSSLDAAIARADDGNPGMKYGVQRRELGWRSVVRVGCGGGCSNRVVVIGVGGVGMDPGEKRRVRRKREQGKSRRDFNFRRSCVQQKRNS